MATKKRKSFTLVELVLYLGLVSVIILFAAFFIMVIFQAKIKNQAIIEVEEQGVQLVNLVGQMIRNAEAVNSPAQGESADTLSIVVDNPTKSPTVFEFSGNALLMTEGSGQTVTLSNDKVIITDANFRNLGRSDTPGIIRIKFTLATDAADKKQEYKYSKTFYASAALR